VNPPDLTTSAETNLLHHGMSDELPARTLRANSTTGPHDSLREVDRSLPDKHKVLETKRAFVEIVGAVGLLRLRARNGTQALPLSLVFP
jgi:hypothetical protein